jgi:hypothetical protein
MISREVKILTLPAEQNRHSPGENPASITPLQPKTSDLIEVAELKRLQARIWPAVNPKSTASKQHPTSAKEPHDMVKAIEVAAKI